MQKSELVASHSAQEMYLFSPKPHRIRKLSFTVLAVVYYLLLAYFYANYVSLLFDYAGLILDYSGDAEIIGTLSIVGLAMLLPSCESLTAAVSATILLFAHIPSVVMWAYGPATYHYFIIETTGVAVVIITSRIVKVPIPQLPKLSIHGIQFIFVGVAISYFAAVIALGGLTYLNFDLMAVYEYRDQASKSLPAVFAYISPVVGKVIIPFIAVLSFARGNAALCLSALGMSVFAFALTSHKDVLFNTFICVLLFWIYRSTNRLIIISAVVLIACVVLSIIDFHFLLKDPEAPSLMGDFGTLFGRRALIVPAFVTHIWIDFFSAHTLIYWSESKLTIGVMTYPYDLPPPQVIGSFYYNNERTAANTGWVGSGFGNAGLFGVVFYSILLGIFISYLNTATKRIPEAFVFATSYVVLSTLILSADLITSLLTNGFLFFVLIIPAIYYREFGNSVSVRRVKSP